MGYTAQSLSCSIMEKPHTGLDEWSEYATLVLWIDDVCLQPCFCPSLPLIVTTFPFATNAQNIVRSAHILSLFIHFCKGPKELLLPPRYVSSIFNDALLLLRLMIKGPQFGFSVCRLWMTIMVHTPPSSAGVQWLDPLIQCQSDIVTKDIMLLIWGFAFHLLRKMLK